MTNKVVIIVKVIIAKQCNDERKYDGYESERQQL